MDLDQLLLKKEEVPIFYETSFYLPIHPSLLRKDIALDPHLANKVFPQAAVEWYAELKEHTETVEDQQIKKWYQDVFLKEEPIIKDGKLANPPLRWHDEVFFDGNGFAVHLSINRNCGGSLYFNEDYLSKPKYIDSPIVNFTPEKFEAYAAPGTIQFTDLPGTRAYVYNPHNIDYFPGALFLRNWALLYLNEALRFLHESF